RPDEEARRNRHDLYVTMPAHHAPIHHALALCTPLPLSSASTFSDVAWWMRQRVAEMGLGQWFHPTITICRKGGLPTPVPPGGHVIQRGDMLHCDFEIVY